MKTITITPEAIAGQTFSASAVMSEKLDGIQGRWNGRMLLTRDGNLIAAPAWFLRQLPHKKLVGELWMGRGRFEECQSTVLRHVPDARWRRVRFMVFEGEAPKAKNVRQIEQIPVRDSGHVRQFAAGIIAKGGEGAVVVDGGTLYKIKAVEDREAEVVGYRKGSGRFEGLLGALTVKDGPILFNLGTGLTDSQRRTPPPIGAVVTYGFQGRTANGKPRFPVFIRERLAA